MEKGFLHILYAFWLYVCQSRKPSGNTEDEGGTDLP